MESSHSDTYWVERMKLGDRQAADILWQRYRDRLHRIARAKLGDAPLRDRDEEDIALSAFNSFYLKAERGAFPQLNNQDELGKLLFVMTLRKSINQFKKAVRYENLVQGESAWMGSTNETRETGIGEVPDQELAAAFTNIVTEVLDALGSEDDPGSTMRRVAILRLEGFEITEIAQQLGISGRSVQRKLATIREMWSAWLKDA